MDIDITLSGYRCFSPHHPVTLSLRGDIIALIGVNNSGKSTLLKSIYEFRSIFRQLTSASGSLIAALNQGAPCTWGPETEDPAELFWHFGKSDLLLEVAVPTDVDEEPRSRRISKAQIRVAHNSNTWYLSLFDLDGSRLKDTKIHTIDGTVSIGGREFSGLSKAFQVLSECFYFPSVRHATCFTPEAGGRSQGKFYDIFSGKPFIEAWSKRQQGQGKFNTQVIRQVTNDIKRIFRYKDLDIHADESRRELLIVADGKSLRLGELGTGLAQFVVLLGNIAFENPSYVLIDEPENNLHPSLQLQFMQSIASRSRCGVVFATHSLGLARQAANRTFALTKNGEECEMTALVETPNLAELVGELSFGRADSLGTRQLLLVEGPTDIMTYEVLLSALDKEHKFAILSLGGTSGISPTRERELEHILALNPSVVAIIDSERSSEDEPLDKNRRGFVEVCKKLAIRCYVLERRAIENYFPERAIRAAFPECLYRGLDKFEHKRDVQPSWPKKNNWRIARYMQKSEIESTDLGEFLASL